MSITSSHGLSILSILGITSCSHTGLAIRPKSDHIASAEYLEKWVERNLNLRDSLREAIAMRGVLNDLPTSARVAQWIYSTTASFNGRTWRHSEMVPLDGRWQSTIDRLLAAVV